MKIQNKTDGFTLLELVIVIGIMGILVQITIPAIQAAREAARRATCKNNLRQIGVASQTHNEAHKHYFSGGWAPTWTPDPNAGFDKNQPGGWLYNILPYIEQSNLRAMGRGLNGEQQSNAMLKLHETVIPGMNCPSRHAAPVPQRVYNRSIVTNRANEPWLRIRYSVKIDYAGNIGDDFSGGINAGYPKSKEQIKGYFETKQYNWYKGRKHNGIIYGRSMIRDRDISDGISKTYLIGEKFLSTPAYESSRDNGDDGSAYAGFCVDTLRAACYVPQADVRTTNPTRRKKKYLVVFGSSHASVWNAVFCDASVHAVSHEISLPVHQHLANRSDGSVVSSAEYE